MPPWLPCFPPQAVSTTNSSLLAPWAVSLHLTADLTLGLLHNPYTPAPSLCAFLGTPISVWGMYGCSKDCLYESHPTETVTDQLPHSLPQMFLLCPNNCPNVGIRPLLPLPHLPRTGPVLLTLLFFSLLLSSYQVLCDSVYFFLVVRYSCPLSAGVLQALMCLKLYS